MSSSWRRVSGVGSPISERLGHVRAGDPVIAGEVRNRPGNLADPMKPSRGQPEAGHRLAQHRVAALVRGAVILYPAGVEPGIRTSLAGQLEVPRRRDTGSDHSAFLATRPGRELVFRERTDLELEIDAIEQRTRDMRAR
jgi:hypothetical protein